MFASSTMDRTLSALGRWKTALLSGGLLTLLFAGPLFAQGGRMDQLFVRDARGNVRQITGTITENGLTNVVVKREEDKESRYESARVDRIIWGSYSNSFREALAFFERGDYENAAAKFGLAATEDERVVIQAVARRKAGESLRRLGTTDPSQYTLALEEFARFITDFPGNRELPEVRILQARTLRLRGGEGDLAEAGTLYRGIFEDGGGEAPASGYDRLQCLEAGLEATRAFLAAEDTLAARELLGVLSNSIRSMSGAAEAGSPQLLALDSLAAEVELGDGFVLLASKQATQAQSFFQARLQATDRPDALRFGAMLGLGEAYVAQGELRKAQLEFARVASIDYTDRDRTARALLGLAETMSRLGDTNGKAQAKARLTAITESFGDTPYAAPARALLEKAM